MQTMMKRYDEILKMDMAELEALSDDKSVEIPEGFDSRLESGLAAYEFCREDKGWDKSLWLRFVLPLPAAAAVIAALVVGFNTWKLYSTPEDSFDDPLMAYAAVEEVLSIVSGKMNAGKSIANAAMPHISITVDAVQVKKVSENE